MSDAVDLSVHPVHLGLGATAVVEPEFTGGGEWYADYGRRHDAGDGLEGRLVSMHTFTESWDVWEMHPAGHEVVLCTAGTITLHQEHADGTAATVTLRAGEYAVNPPGTWHTADVDATATDTATAVFITAGMGTEHRPR
jgi:quercetin dioxygenase-like cupin family protein